MKAKFILIGFLFLSSQANAGNGHAESIARYQVGAFQIQLDQFSNEPRVDIFAGDNGGRELILSETVEPWLTGDVGNQVNVSPDSVVLVPTSHSIFVFHPGLSTFFRIPRRPLIAHTASFFSAPTSEYPLLAQLFTGDEYYPTFLLLVDINRASYYWYHIAARVDEYRKSISGLVHALANKELTLKKFETGISKLFLPIVRLRGESGKLRAFNLSTKGKSKSQVSQFSPHGFNREIERLATSRLAWNAGADVDESQNGFYSFRYLRIHHGWDYSVISARRIRRLEASRFYEVLVPISSLDTAPSAEDLAVVFKSGGWILFPGKDPGLYYFISPNQRLSDRLFEHIKGARPSLDDPGFKNFQLYRSIAPLLDPIRLTRDQYLEMRGSYDGCSAFLARILKSNEQERHSTTDR